MTAGSLERHTVEKFLSYLFALSNNNILVSSRNFGGLMGRSQAGNSGDLQDRSLADNFVQFMVDASNLCRYRKLFVTREGYIGLGPQAMQAGVLCCILFGARLPYILRRVCGRYVLVGESYIHGVMQGEIVDAW